MKNTPAMEGNENDRDSLINQFLFCLTSPVRFRVITRRVITICSRGIKYPRETVPGVKTSVNMKHLLFIAIALLGLSVSKFFEPILNHIYMYLDKIELKL